MTKEEARQAAKVMLAWADGKEVEGNDRYHTGWIEILEPQWDWRVNRYRIKPEPTYRHFQTADEVMDAIKKHGDWVKGIHSGSRMKIVEMLENTIFVWNCIGSSGVSLVDAFAKYVFADGTPFGVKEE